MMKRSSIFYPARWSLSIVVFALFVHAAQGQSRATADQGIRLQAYALGTYVRPDFLGPTRNGGATAGVNVNIFRFFGRVDPSLDLRAMGSFGSVSHQFFYGGGPRVVVTFGRIQPFGEFLIGTGRISFPHPADPNYTHDDSLTRVYGGGLDVGLTRDFALRAEALRQDWQLSSNVPPFHPVSISVGARYQVHFSGRGGPGF